MRVLSDVIDDVEPDLSMREAKIGDRYLLCSDGLSGVVSFDTIQDTMAAGKDPAPTCEQLVQLALRGGAPDNVTCIVADIVDAVGTPTETVPVVVGAASLQGETRAASGGSAAERAAELTSPGGLSAATTDVPTKPGRDTRRIFRVSLATLVVLGLLGGGGYGATAGARASSSSAVPAARSRSFTDCRRTSARFRSPVWLRWLRTCRSTTCRRTPVTR